MLDDPDKCATSDLSVRVADGGVCREESEGRFGDKPALVMSKFGSILPPAGAVADHSAVVIFENEMYVVSKAKLTRTRRTLFQLSQLSTKTSNFRIPKKNGIFSINPVEFARQLVRGPKTSELARASVSPKIEGIVNEASYFTTRTDTKLELDK